MDEPNTTNQKVMADFLEMVERLYFESYSLKQILQCTTLPDGSLAIPDWEQKLDARLSNKLLADIIPRTKFAPLTARIRDTTHAEVVDEVLRSIARESSKE